MVPLMSVWRNFFLGAEPTKGIGPLRWIDAASAKQTVRHGAARDGNRHPRSRSARRHALGRRAPVGCDRARRHFGARVLILDEPTSALGVKQAGVVLKYILQARNRGVAVIFITHNPHHAYPVGDRFLILNRGQEPGNFAKAEIELEELVRLMAGGRELVELSTSSRGSPPSSRARRNRVERDPPLADRAGHHVQVVEVVAGARGDRVEAAGNEDDVAVARGEGLVERAVGRVDALEREAARQAASGGSTSPRDRSRGAGRRSRACAAGSSTSGRRE